MPSPRRGRYAAWMLAASLAAAAAPAARAQTFRLLDWKEATIADLHRALDAGTVDCEGLVRRYLARIEAYDGKLNAIVTVNPRALERAREIGQRIARDGVRRRLECVPVIVKDNYDTADMPTTAGSASLAGSIPPDDAFQVRKLREAGAIVLAKSNMAEFAFSPYETLGSILPGHTRNPYDLDRVPAGSSGGTAAAVAASFGAVGLGTDTGNSIRGPSSHTALVGIRSTMGLTSRDGIVPLNLLRDIGGPMARTVEDAALVLDVIAGYDPADPVTAPAREHRAESYVAALTRDGLSGARIGVLRALFEPDATHPEILALMERAIEDLRRGGAVIVDPVSIPELETIPTSRLWCNPFKEYLEAYLASLGPAAPVTSLAAILEGRRFHPSIEKRLVDAAAVDEPVEEECREALEASERLRRGVREALRADGLDALVYPSWSHPPRRLGDLVTPHGNNSPRIAPPTGFPALTVPMGWVDGRLPAGLQLLGDAWSEPTLIRIAYAYEQATRHRRPPPTTPPLPP